MWLCNSFVYLYGLQVHHDNYGNISSYFTFRHLINLPTPTFNHDYLAKPRCYWNEMEFAYRIHVRESSSNLLEISLYVAAADPRVSRDFISDKNAQLCAESNYSGWWNFVYKSQWDESIVGKAGTTWRINNL